MTANTAHRRIADGAGARIMGADGDTIGVFDVPWAYDAAGLIVPTRYEIDGSTLTQVVEHSSSFAYQVVANPPSGVDTAFT